MVIRRGLLTIDGQSPSGSMETLAPGIAWNADAYEQAVEGQLGRIRLQPIGRLLLETIRRPVTIVPNPRTFAAAGAGPLGADNYEVLSGLRAGHVVRDGRTGEPMEGFGVGLGGGTSAIVQFTPGEWMDGSRLRGNRKGPGSRPDQVLFHELFHAMRSTMGLLDRRPLRGELADYHNYAEFFAIVVSNVYISQANGGDLRANHGVNGPALSNPMTFMWNENHQRLIQILCSDQPGFTRAIALQRAFFNPFKDHYVANGQVSHRDIRVHQQAQH